MRYAAANEPELVPYLALAIFAGIRPDPDNGELSRLDWKAIDFDRREIFISEHVSKTNDERIVKMTDNLVAWLLPHRQSVGPVFYSRRAFDRLRKKTGVRWGQDCMRHSFGSYHLAMWSNMGETMEQMGDTNARTFKNHYRRAVRKEDAERFWSIAPKADGKVIRLHRTA